MIESFLLVLAESTFWSAFIRGRYFYVPALLILASFWLVLLLVR